MQIDEQPRHEAALIAPDTWYCPWCKRLIIWDENGRRVIEKGDETVIHFGMTTIRLEPEPVVVRK